MRFAFRFLLLPIVLLIPAAASVAEAQAHPPPAGRTGQDVCLECHDETEFVTDNIHHRIQAFEVQDRDIGCEGCHGAGGRHVEEGDTEAIRSFAVDDYDASEACLSCHRTKKIREWQASVHAAEEVACVSCHGVHGETRPEESCATCHADSVAQFRMPSHHPLPEGKMSCSSCHDVHAATEAMLKTRQRSSDLCYTCHLGLEGPFIFEHPPVQEDCMTCHQPHGSAANNLLTANEPMLCLQCHEFHFHAGYRSADAHEVDVGGFERENPFGARGFNMAYTTSCTQCHSHIHGSDLPSQTVTGTGAFTN